MWVKPVFLQELDDLELWNRAGNAIQMDHRFSESRNDPKLGPPQNCWIVQKFFFRKDGMDVPIRSPVRPTLLEQAPFARQEYPIQRSDRSWVSLPASGGPTQMTALLWLPMRFITMRFSPVPISNICFATNNLRSLLLILYFSFQSISGTCWKELVQEEIVPQFF